MAHKRKKYTWQIPPSEVHALAVRKGRAGHAGKGKKKGTKNKRPKRNDPSPGERRVFVFMLESSRVTFRRCAAFERMAATAFIAKVCERLRADPTYAGLFGDAGGVTPQPQRDAASIADIEHCASIAKLYQPGDYATYIANMGWSAWMDAYAKEPVNEGELSPLEAIQRTGWKMVHGSIAR